MLWTDGSVPFPFDKGGSGVLANCSLNGPETNFSFSAGPVCSSFSAEICGILHALCWFWQHQQVCHFSLFSSYVILALSSSPCPLLHLSFYVNLSGRSGRNYLLFPPDSSGCNGSPDTIWNDAANELAMRGALLVPSAILCSLSPLVSRIHSSLFSDWMRTISSKFFNSQFPSIFTEELVLPRHARCVLSRLCCNGHSLLSSSYYNWQNRESFLQRLRILVPGHLSSHSALSSYGLFAPFALLRLSLSTISDLGPWSCPASGAP